MKKNIFSALVCAFIAVSFTGCIEENLEPVIPAKKGEEVIFGARAGFENGNPGTRTEYSGVTYTAGGRTFERIDWVEAKDQIHVYCAEALGEMKKADYMIKHTNVGGQRDSATLVKTTPNGLQWGEGTHNFYAIYPSPEMISESSTNRSGIYIDATSKKLHGIIPSEQTPLSIKDTTINEKSVKWAEPDMTYAYMVAKKKATPDQGAISLTFVPLVTAVQIELVAQIDTKITDIKVYAPNIAGVFTADLAGWSGMPGEYPDCANGTAAEMSDVVNLTMWQGTEGSLAPYELKAGESLIFTVFLNPTANVSNLKVSYDQGAGAISKTLKGSTITAKCKTRINNLKMNDGKVEVDHSHWMSQLNPATTIAQLSLPGTGGSFSYGSDQSGYYKSQTLDFGEQWERGIRAFEIVSSQRKTSFASEILTCNKEDITIGNRNLTVKEVVDSLLNRLAKPNCKETAMAIFTYQSNGGSDSQNSVSYMAKAMTYFNTISSDKLVLFKPGLTLNEAKGKLMIVVRPNQRDQNNGGTWSDITDEITGINADKILVIDGCGTAKDKWGARGYKINNTRAFDISNGNGTGSGIMEYHMQQGDYISPTKTSAPVSLGEPQFNYTTNISTITCWFQEWARVIKNNSYIAGGGGWLTSYSATWWFESYTEKLSNAKETFSKALSDVDGKMVYINSLCGYLATDEDSFTDDLVPSVGNAWGGSGGDIKALADKLNYDFYQYVLSSGMDQATGPTGIILMDYVSNQETDGGAYYLPGVIINNNFKHNSNVIIPQKTSGGQTPGGGGSTDPEQDTM